MTVGSQERNDEISELSGGQQIWIGLNDRKVNLQWRWSDGTHIDECKFHYTNWNDGEPNDWGGSEDCIEQLNEFGNFQWNDMPCESTQRTFVCEIICVGTLNPVWSEWSGYGPCSKSCGSSCIKTRNRTCLVDENTPVHGSKFDINLYFPV